MKRRRAKSVGTHSLRRFLNQEFKKTELGIFVPASYLETEQQTPIRARLLDFALTTVSWDMITGLPATIEDIVDRLKRYSLREIVWLISRISLTLAPEEKGHLGNPETQALLLTKILGEDVAQAIWKKLAEDPDFDRSRTTFFNERQLLNTLKLSFLVLESSDEPPGPVGVRLSLVSFVEALLMVSYVMDVEDGRVSASENLTKQQRLELYLYANLLFNASGDQLRETVRAHYFFIEQHPEISTKGEFLSLPDLLATTTGLGAERTWAALTALYAGFSTYSTEDIDDGKVGTSRTNYLKLLSNLQADEADQWFSLGAKPAGELQALVRARYSLDQPFWFDVLPFEISPLVAFGDVVFCVSLPLLRRLQTLSIWHRLIGSSLPVSTRKAALDTRGKIFEKYTAAILRRAFKNKFFDEETLNAQINPSRASKGPRLKDPVCDGVICLDDTVLLVEMKESSIRLEARQARSYEVYRNKRQEMVVRAATQLFETGVQIRAGRLRGLGLDPAKIRHLLPIIISLDQQSNPMLYRAMSEDDLRLHPLGDAIRRGEFEPFQMFHIEDVEWLEVLVETGADIRQLLVSKARSPADVGLELRQYTYGNAQIGTDSHGKWYEDRFNEINETLTVELRAAGMETTPTDESDSD